MATHIIKPVETEELANESGYKIVKTAIFYAALSMIVAMVVVPWNNFDTNKMASVISGDIDTTVTGSVKNPQGKSYRVRRSVLQADPRKPCYVFADGTVKGDC